MECALENKKKTKTSVGEHGALSKDILEPKNLQAFPPPLVTGSLVASTESTEVLLAVDVLPSHNIVAVGCSTQLLLLDGTTLATIRESRASMHKDRIRAVRFSHEKGLNEALNHSHPLNLFPVDPGVVTITLDGAMVATGGHDRRVIVWDRDNGKVLSMLRDGQVGATMSLMWSKNDDILYSTATDGSVVGWNWRKSRKVSTFMSHSSTVQSINMHPSLPRAITSSTTGEAAIWDVLNHMQLGTVRPVDGWDDVISSEQVSSQAVSALVGPQASSNPAIPHQGALSSASWSPCGRLVITSSVDGTVKLWDAVSFLKNPQDMAQAKEVQLQGQCGDSSRVNVAESSDFDASHEIKNVDLTLHRAPGGLVLPSTGKFVPPLSWHKQVKSFVGNTNVELLSAAAHSCATGMTSLNNAGREDAEKYPRHALVPAPSAGETYHTDLIFTFPHSTPVHDVVMSPDSTLIFSTTADGQLCVWSAVSGHLLFNITLPAAVSSLKYDMQRHLVYLTCQHHLVVVHLQISARHPSQSQATVRTSSLSSSPSSLAKILGSDPRTMKSNLKSSMWMSPDARRAEERRLDLAARSEQYQSQQAAFTRIPRHHENADRMLRDGAMGTVYLARLVARLDDSRLDLAAIQSNLDHAGLTATQVLIALSHSRFNPADVLAICGEARKTAAHRSLFAAMAAEASLGPPMARFGLQPNPDQLSPFDYISLSSPLQPGQIPNNGIDSNLFFFDLRRTSDHGRRASTLLAPDMVGRRGSGRNASIRSSLAHRTVLSKMGQHLSSHQEEGTFVDNSSGNDKLLLGQDQLHRIGAAPKPLTATRADAHNAVTTTPLKPLALAKKQGSFTEFHQDLIAPIAPLDNPSLVKRPLVRHSRLVGPGPSRGTPEPLPPTHPVSGYGATGNDVGNDRTLSEVGMNPLAHQALSNVSAVRRSSTIDSTRIKIGVPGTPIHAVKPHVRLRNGTKAPRSAGGSFTASTPNYGSVLDDSGQEFLTWWSLHSAQEQPLVGGLELSFDPVISSPASSKTAGNFKTNPTFVGRATEGSIDLTLQGAGSGATPRRGTLTRAGASIVRFGKSVTVRARSMIFRRSVSSATLQQDQRKQLYLPRGVANRTAPGAHLAKRGRLGGPSANGALGLDLIVVGSPMTARVL